MSDLERQRRSKNLLGYVPAELEAFAAYHLNAKAATGEITFQWMEAVEMHLAAAIAFWCPIETDKHGKPILRPDGKPERRTRALDTIGVADVQAYRVHLSKMKRHGRTVSPGTVRQSLNSLSNLYRRAAAEGHALPGCNPVAAMMEKPRARRPEARWLEVPDASLLLESARVFKPSRKQVALPFTYPLLATFLLTGGRAAEVLGLEVEDVSFDRRTVTFRPNQWRRLKTATSFRTVPLWPQLETILREYIFGGSSPRASGLLFPSHRSAAPAMLTAIRKVLDAVAKRAGWKSGAIRSKMLRHTFCSARLQTLDRGAPVSPFTCRENSGTAAMHS